MMRNPNKPRKPPYALILAVALGVGAASCAEATNPSPPAKTINLTFDSLGGGSNIIETFPGVDNSAADEKENGTYYAGTVVPAECKTVGRTVMSDPSVGELNRQSDQWIRIDYVPGDTQYATAVYIEDPGKILSELKDC